MKKHFYSDLVSLDTVLVELATLNLTSEEKKEIEELAHAHLHEVILDAILSELSVRDKKIFLANLEYDTHEKIWKHLNEKVENVEGKIKNAADRLKAELREDVKQVKKGSR